MARDARLGSRLGLLPAIIRALVSELRQSFLPIFVLFAPSADVKKLAPGKTIWAGYIYIPGASVVVDTDDGYLWCKYDSS